MPRRHLPGEAANCKRVAGESEQGLRRELLKREKQNPAEAPLELSHQLSQLSWDLFYVKSRFTPSCWGLQVVGNPNPLLSLMVL